MGAIDSLRKMVGPEMYKYATNDEHTELWRGGVLIAQCDRGKWYSRQERTPEFIVWKVSTSLEVDLIESILTTLRERVK